LLIFTDRRLSTAQHPVSGIRIYPNPFQSTLLIESPDDDLLQLYAANGQLLISMPLDAGLNRIETSDLPAGLYLICIGQHRETLLKH
jgi:Secretion system C-terminal sorting domain